MAGPEREFRYNAVQFSMHRWADRSPNRGSTLSSAGNRPVAMALVSPVASPLVCIDVHRYHIRWSRRRRCHDRQPTLVQRLAGMSVLDLPMERIAVDGDVGVPAPVGPKRLESRAAIDIRVGERRRWRRVRFRLERRRGFDLKRKDRDR